MHTDMFQSISFASFPNQTGYVYNTQGMLQLSIKQLGNKYLTSFRYKIWMYMGNHFLPQWLGWAFLYQVLKDGMLGLKRGRTYNTKTCQGVYRKRFTAVLKPHQYLEKGQHQSATSTQLLNAYTKLLPIADDVKIHTHAIPWAGLPGTILQLPRHKMFKVIAYQNRHSFWYQAANHNIYLTVVDFFLYIEKIIGAYFYNSIFILYLFGMARAPPHAGQISYSLHTLSPQNASFWPRQVLFCKTFPHFSSLNRFYLVHFRLSSQAIYGGFLEGYCQI